VAALVPASSAGIFYAPWLIAALSQPVNSLSFGTDGVHWGTGDFRYLRNAVLAATGTGVFGLFWVNTASPSALTQLWIVTAIWIAVRASFGVLRIWPAIGKAPLSSR